MSRAASVLKLGGSLLQLPDLEPRIRRLLTSSGIASALIVVGGGRSADRVRQWQQQFALDEDAAHWLAIASMTANARLLTRLWSGATLVASREEAEVAWQAQRLPFLDAARFLQTEEARLDAERPELPDRRLVTASQQKLPISWDVTSDAISGWIAARWPADALHLLKSCDPEANDLRDLSTLGMTDAILPQVIPAALAVHWTNLKCDAVRPVKIEPHR